MDKNLYKLFLIIVKIMPNILAVLQLTVLILNYFGFTSFIVTCIGGTSLMFLSLLYLLSFVFKFCGTHRLSLNYITINYFITIIDYYIGIPLNIEHMFYLYAFISGIFIITWLITWYKNRNNPKIDHIKNLCDKFIDCNYN